ncbi:MAG: thiol peroxidase [Lentisphaerae bacterium]|jgi:thioredoxin-dependent peroxiredoxin|nr:thiol peroxidase [Lentisphaerota bacterium]MBT4820516.1 thiol peroxidase [Lentisphaerota bacterium]MBT5608110.1 thiol peroxidase [Lentisphaerota bacterium]MBT7060613.1 thiol peroxidase [Lentisphaerota bacterium]MBT7847712.1 thiol peroxidase [Lentisphaerota bacterium]
MSERTGIVTLLGNPVTLGGDALSVGAAAPDAEVVNGELSPVSILDLPGKVNVILSVPSLDTPVCDTETRRFNQEAAGLGEDVSIAVVSMDLPFAQGRWCGAAGVDQVTPLSDHLSAAFGEAYGVLIKEVRLLARAVFVVDAEGIVRYAETVGEVADEPDYNAVLEAVKKCL